LKPPHAGDRDQEDVHTQIAVPGFVAVVSADDAAKPMRDEIDRFADAYEAICGPCSRLAHGAPLARVVQFGAVGAGPAHGSWTVTAGVAHEGEGQFARIGYDEGSQSVSLTNDPFGMFPLFRASRGRMHYFSTSVLALARHLGAAPDVLGLHVFLRTGYHFGTRTNWTGIERVDPAQRLVFTREGLHVERYWRPEADEAVASLDLEQAALHCTEACLDTFRRLYGRQPEAWADLTGGYDSRLLTLALRRAGVRFRSNTVGADWMEDVRLAKQVAQAAELPWTRFSPPSEPAEQLDHLFPLALAAGHGHLDVVELARVLATHEEKRAHSTTLLTGGGGEHFQYYAWQTEFARAGRSTKVDVDAWARMRMLGPAVDTSLFARYSQRQVEGDLRDRSVAWIAPYRDEVNTRQLDLLYAYKMMGHFGAYTGAASSVLRAELPFYTRPVFRAAFSTSHRHRNGHRLMGHMIEGLEPRASTVTTTRGGPAQPLRLTNLHRFAPYYARLGSKAVQKVTGVELYRPRGERRLPASPRWRLAALRVLADPDPRSFRSRALFERRELDRLVGGLDGALFGRVLTVEAALRAVDAEV
jgi:hypothetical protein